MPTGRKVTPALLLRAGAGPLRRGTVPGEVLHRYTMPLVGVLEEQERLLGDEARPLEEGLEEVTRGEQVLAVALDGRIVAWEAVVEAAGPLAEIVDLLSDRALTVL